MRQQSYNYLSSLEEIVSSNGLLFYEVTLLKVFIHDKEYVTNHLEMCSCGCSYWIREAEAFIDNT